MACLLGWRQTDLDVRGAGKQFIAAASAAECAEACLKREGCQVFEFSAARRTCGTYTDGIRNIDNDKLQASEWVSCVHESKEIARGAYACEQVKRRLTPKRVHDHSSCATRGQGGFHHSLAKWSRAACD